MENKIKELRAKANMSQGKLAEVSGLHVMVISKIERGISKIENTTLLNAYKLSKALGVSMEDLLPDEYKTDSEPIQSHEDVAEPHGTNTKSSLTPEQLQEIAMKAVQDALASASK